MQQCRSLCSADMCQPGTSALKRQPALRRILELLVLPVCAERFHSHHKRATGPPKPALPVNRDLLQYAETLGLELVPYIDSILARRYVPQYGVRYRT